MHESPTVALALTVHHPDERIAPMMDQHLEGLVQPYAAATAYCSFETHPAIVDRLRDHGVGVRISRGESQGIDGIGPVRRETIRAGLEASTTHLQMCDFDRALHWAACYPQELDQVRAEITRYDLLVLGRTPRAWATHPPYQAETEPFFNRVFALTTGRDWDIGAGSRGLSRRAAETLLEISQESTVGVDAEWPLLLLNRPGFLVGHRPCEGLEFETADRCGPEIERAGSYAAWEAEVCAQPENWAFRLRVAWLIAEAVLRYGQPGA